MVVKKHLLLIQVHKIKFIGKIENEFICIDAGKMFEVYICESTYGPGFHLVIIVLRARSS